MSHIANSNIRVDNFQYRQADKTRYVYFLSHCHEDHLRGLSNNWSQGKIYTSYLSKQLILDRWPGLKDFVIDLEMDEEHWIYLDEDKRDGVSVILMDAFHCPGAVMFLFKGKMGTVLHTGDFRFAEAMFDNELLCPVERRNPQFKGITVECDYLHLDNTFANPEYDFPSREEAYQGLVNIVKSHKDHRIFLFSYNLGKEEVFLNLANDFKCKIVVDEDRMRKIKLMNLKPELFTTDPTQSHVHIRSIRDLKAHDINQCNREFPTIFIILTGWNDKYNKNLPFYFKVPYSSHSNYRELERFVKAVNPAKLIFNVHERNDTKKRQEFQSYLSREYERSKSSIVPPISKAVNQVIASQQTGCERYRQQAEAALSGNYFDQKYRKGYEAAPKQSASISSGYAKPNQTSLLHPAISNAKAAQLQQQPQHVMQGNIKAGYQGAVAEMTSRFDVNNRELNKRKFNDQYAHIISASKAKGSKGAKGGSKFVLREMTLSLTPPNEANQGEEASACQAMVTGSIPSNEVQTVRPLKSNEIKHEESVSGLYAEKTGEQQDEDLLRLEDSESNQNSNASRLSAQIGAIVNAEGNDVVVQIGEAKVEVGLNEEDSSNASQLSNQHSKKRKRDQMTKLAKSFQKGPPVQSKRRKLNEQSTNNDLIIKLPNRQEVEIGTDLKPTIEADTSIAADQNLESNRLACLEEQRIKEAQQKAMEARMTRSKKQVLSPTSAAKSRMQGTFVEKDNPAQISLSKKTTIATNGDHEEEKQTESLQKQIKNVNKGKPDKSFLDSLRKQIHQHQESLLKSAINQGKEGTKT